MLLKIYPIGSIDKNRVITIAEDFVQLEFVKIGFSDNIDDFIFSYRSALNLNEEEFKYLKNKKIITMCVDPDWMPLEKIENSKHIGIAADYMQIVSKKINTPIVLVPTSSWMESMNKAKNRECDIFSIASETNDRKKYMDFTKSYLALPLVLATRLDKTFIGSLSEIRGKSVAIVEGYSIAQKIEKYYPEIKIEYVKSITEGLEVVESGKVYAYIDNLMVTSYNIQKYFTGNFKVSGRLDKDLYLSVATRNDETI